MADRLFYAVLGNRDSGKSRTWNSLFGHTVRTSPYPRHLKLAPGECVEVFLVSGSPEERGKYVADILGNQNARIVLCSTQYIERVEDTFGYAFERGFDVHVQWLNPGYQDPGEVFDRLGLGSSLLHRGATLSMRNGKRAPARRVQDTGGNLRLGKISEPDHSLLIS
jgi:hypothetical protein